MTLKKDGHYGNRPVNDSTENTVSTTKEIV